MDVVAGGFLILAGAVSLMRNPHTVKAPPIQLDIPKTDTKTEVKNKNTQSKDYSVYVLKDKKKKVQYVGRTKSIATTKLRHKANLFRKDLDLQELHSGLSRDEARGLEQYYMTEKFKTLNRSNPQNNQINGISPLNPNKTKYMSAAEAYLRTHPTPKIT
jgi:hypothetical protein